MAVAAESQMSEQSSASSINENNETRRNALHQVSSLGERPSVFNSTAAEVLFVIAATMSVGMTSIVTGGLSVVTSEIGQDLNMTNSEITWILASANLAGGAFLLFFGRVADLTSKRWQFIGSMFIFALISLGTGFAKDPILFDVLTGLLGLLSAAAVPSAIGSLGAIYPEPCKRKNYAFACFSAGNPLGFVIGCLSSGICTKIFNWRSYLWFMALMYLCFTIIAFFVTPVDKSDKKPFAWSTFRDFDIIGTLLTVAGFGTFSAALSLSGDAPEGWRTPYVIATLVSGLVLILVFLWWETRATSPLLPMWIWRDRDFSFLMIILFLCFGSFTSASFWITLYIQRYRVTSALMVAVYVLPMVIMGLTANVVAGLILHRVDNKLIMYFATFCFPLSWLLLGLNRDASSYWYFMFWTFCLCVWGADLQFNVANMYVMTSLSSKQQSTGGGIFQTCIRLSATIFMGVTTAIYNAAARNPPKTGFLANQNSAPYNAVFYFCSGSAAISFFFVPFLRVGKQGGRVKETQSEKPEGIQDDQAKNKVQLEEKIA